jgi:hypothetical protein
LKQKPHFTNNVGHIYGRIKNSKKKCRCPKWMLLNRNKYCSFYSFSDQLWLFSNENKLINKANVWKSDEDWQMKENKDSTMFYIEKTSNKVVLGETSAGKVVPENLFEDNPGQLWVKGMVDNLGYFTLINSKSKTFLTAISEKDLAAKGKSDF